MSSLDFEIRAGGPVSKAFWDRAIITFGGACKYVTHLPYGRNADKNDLLTVFTDGRGTCGTKHALLKRLADENGVPGLNLMVGLYKMSGQNTPPVHKVLSKYGLDYLPEAHNYLRYAGNILDCTAVKPLNFLPDLLDEIEIRPDQITDYKVNHHKKFLDNWRTASDSRYSLDELWDIREACIAALAGL